MTRTRTTARPRSRTPARPRVRRRFGQHFLAESWARRIVDAIGVQPGDVFLEIGPGTGALTLPLAATGAPVLAVEIDRDLVASLAPRLPGHVTLVTGDVLKTDVLGYLAGLAPQRPPAALEGEPVPRRGRIAANLPYNVAAPIIARMLEWHQRHAVFADATIMVQQEVADRILARPGRKDYGPLSVFVQVHARVTRLLNLPPGAFSPPPKVRSTVLRLEFAAPAAAIPDERLFERMVKALFGARRKTLRNAIRQFDPKHGPAVLEASGLDARRRPETLAVAELADLAARLSVAKRLLVL